jgi:antitoxin CptB
MSDTLTEAKSAELKRLRWQCRRGMREMDMLLERWLDKHYADASPELLQDFAALLKTEDDVLWDWIMGKGGPDDAAQAALILAIQSSFTPRPSVTPL